MSERLEEIKRGLRHLSLIDRDEEGTAELNIITVQEDLEYLVKQAERVEELEEMKYLDIKLKHYQKVAEMQNDEINWLLGLNKKLSLQIGREVT